MSAEISREALLIYLDDLRTLETLVHESDEKIGEINNRKTELKSEYDNFEKSRPVKPNIKKPEKPTTTRFSEIKDRKIVAMIFLITGILNLVLCLLFFCLGEYEEILRFNLISGVIGTCVGGLMLRSVVPLQKSIEEEYSILVKIYESTCKANDDDQKKYQTECRIYREKCEKEKQILDSKLSDGDTYISEIRDDINEVSEQLQQAYSANIIPLQFRNIQGIYYLYDYISTSNQGLSEALMQCNLEAIKEKLDNVIKLQGENIIMQAKANAALYEQNQRMLKSLSDLNSKADDITSNTFVAAKYAQISATNSAVALKMQAKSLAYQKADFWLN